MRLYKFILSLMLGAASVIPAVADTGDKHFNVNVGVQWPRTINASLGLERDCANGNSFELFAEAGNHYGTPVCHNFWTGYYGEGGLNFKFRLVKFKNANLKLVTGAYAGMYLEEFNAGGEVSFEYNYIFANDWELSLKQRNNFTFLAGDMFRNGVMVGVKIPL